MLCVLLILVVATTACAQEPHVQEIHGILLDVQANDLVQAESVTLRTDDGKVRVFRVSPKVSQDPQHPNTASHLRQHMTVADRVVVLYQDEPTGPIAVQIYDEPRGH